MSDAINLLTFLKIVYYFVPSPRPPFQPSPSLAHIEDCLQLSTMPFLSEVFSPEVLVLLPPHKNTNKSLTLSRSEQFRSF